MEIKKVEKFEFNGIIYDTEKEAKIAAGVEELRELAFYFGTSIGPDEAQREIFRKAEGFETIGRAASILAEGGFTPKQPEAVQEDWPAKGWKKLKKKPYVKVPELDPYRMEEFKGLPPQRICISGVDFIKETEEVKNKLEFMALLKIRNCKLEKEYRDLTGVEAKRFEELRKILGV